MKTTPFLCLILLIFSACNKNTKEAFDRKLMLENIGSKVIVPCFSELSQQSSKLLESLKNLQGEFSEDNLEKSRAQWKQYSIAWAECELFNFGAFKDTYLSTKIAAYPFKVSNMKRNIDEAGADAEINGEFISSKGSNSKGMWAVEYLLFDKEGITVIATKSDKRTETDKATAISRNSWPISSSIIRIGINTATVVRADTKIAPHIFLAPLIHLRRSYILFLPSEYQNIPNGLKIEVMLIHRIGISNEN